MAIRSQFDGKTLPPPARRFSEREDAARRASIRGSNVQNPFVRAGNDALLDVLSQSVAEWNPEFLNRLTERAQDDFFATEVRVDPAAFEGIDMAQALFFPQDRSIALRGEEGRQGTSLLFHEGLHRLDVPAQGPRRHSENFIGAVRQAAEEDPDFAQALLSPQIPWIHWVAQGKPQPQGYAGREEELFAYIPSLIDMDPNRLPLRLRPYYDDIFNFDGVN